MPERVSLAFQGLVQPPNHIIDTYGPTIVEMEMSHNRVSDLKFLSELPRLQSLVLDHNRISSHVKIAHSPCLETLWVNHNKIGNLGLFITTLAQSCPNLRILSMMNNAAAPSYFNGGTYPQFKDYRYFVISHLDKLEVLDDTKITTEELSEAHRLYPVSLVKTKRKSRKKSDTKNQ